MMFVISAVVVMFVCYFIYRKVKNRNRNHDQKSEPESEPEPEPEI